MQADYPFKQPVFILAAPRSGSTLLFETLLHAKSLWTIGDESHNLIEGNTRLRPGFGNCDDNRLTAEHLIESDITYLRQAFFQSLRNRDGMFAINQPTSAPFIMLEKTPKNALRIPMILKVFPDARFIYLYRDPRENISSIIEAWRSGRFVTYPLIAGNHFPWSLLLPPGWKKLVGKPLEEVAAFQWQAANEYALHDLAHLGTDQWTAICADDLIQSTRETIHKLCHFMRIDIDEHLESICSGELKMSRYTLTTPQPGKWRKNADVVQRVLPLLEKTIQLIENSVKPYSQTPVLLEKNN